MKNQVNDNDYKISIIMSVFNDEHYLPNSIESIINQTYTNFEFIIVNDGSTDNSKNIIINYQKKDKRIIFIDQARKGLTKSLNIAIKASNCNYIARQDSDDISNKSRLENQINFFKIKKDYALCGSFAEIINDKGKVLKKKKSVIHSTNIKKKLKYTNIFIHPSIMINKKIIPDFQYDERYKVSQDYELWTRISKKYNCQIIPKFLIKNRIHQSNISYKYSLNQEKNSVIIGFLYSVNLQLPSINIRDISISFDDIIKYFSEKNLMYKEDLKIRKYVYLYKLVPSIYIFKIKFIFLHKLFIFYLNKPSMLYKRILNLIGA